jgi:hypothetical protein
MKSKSGLVVACCIAWAAMGQPARADVAIAQAYLFPFSPDASPCGGSMTGTTNASISFGCTYDLGHALSSPFQLGVFSGQATAQTRVGGPYGLGLSVDADSAFGETMYTYGLAYTQTYAEASFTELVVPQGGVGSANMKLTFGGQFGLFAGSAHVNVGPVQGVLNNFVSTMTVPVVFGQAYPFSFEASSKRSGAAPLDDVDFAKVYLSAVSFSDAAGNPIAGASLTVVPEPSGLMLLGGVVASLFGFRRAGRFLFPGSGNTLQNAENARATPRRCPSRPRDGVPAAV